MLRRLPPCIALVVFAGLSKPYVASQGPGNLAGPVIERMSDSQANTTFLLDDFESYPAGVFPARSGWFVVHPGRGGTVDNTQSYSGVKSWRFDDGPVVQRNYTLPSPPPSVIAFECRVKVTRRAGIPFAGEYDFAIWAGECGGHTGSHGFGLLAFMPQPESWELPWPAFCRGCKEYLHFNRRYRGPEVSFGKWYKLKARFDLGEDTGSVWLDDQLVFSRVPLGSDPSLHFAPSITIEAGRWGPKGVAWVDDVRVYSDGAPSDARVQRGRVRWRRGPSDD